MQDAVALLALLAGRAVGVTLLFAAWGKFSSRSATVDSVEQFRILPTAWARRFGLTIPWLELAVGIALLLGLFPVAACATAVGLLVLFSLAQVFVLLRGLQVPCGCFGTLSSRVVRWTSVAGNLGLVLCCVVAASFSLSEPTIGLSTTEHLELGLIAGVLVTQWIVFGQLRDNKRQERDHRQYVRDQAALLALQGGLMAGARGEVR